MLMKLTPGCGRDTRVLRRRSVNRWRGLPRVALRLEPDPGRGQVLAGGGVALRNRVLWSVRKYAGHCRSGQHQGLKQVMMSFELVNFILILLIFTNST